MACTSSWPSEGGLVAGFYRLDGQPPTAELADLFVDPAMAGRGVGRRLLQHALEQGRILGFKATHDRGRPSRRGFLPARGRDTNRHRPQRLDHRTTSASLGARRARRMNALGAISTQRGVSLKGTARASCSSPQGIPLRAVSGQTCRSGRGEGRFSRRCCQCRHPVWRRPAATARCGRRYCGIARELGDGRCAVRPEHRWRRRLSRLCG